MVNFWLLVLIAAPIVLTYFMKSDAALAYLALCAGFVLLSLTTSNLQELLDHSNVHLNNNTLGLILLASPPLLTLLVTRKTVHGQSNILMQLVPALLLGGLLALIAVPLLDSSVQNNFTDSGLWGQLQKVQAWIIAIGAVASLALVWSEHIHGLRRRR
jgi:hypothetical protein